MTNFCLVPNNPACLKIGRPTTELNFHCSDCSEPINAQVKRSAEYEDCITVAIHPCKRCYPQDGHDLSGNQGGEDRDEKST